MPSSESLSWWLGCSALSSLAILTLGSIATLLARQPARRLRIIELSLIGCLFAPMLSALPGYPRWAILRPAVATRDAAADGAQSRVLSNPATGRPTEDGSLASGDVRLAPGEAATMAQAPAAEPAAVPGQFSFDVG
ncbi:MAG: hypothetical protein ABFC96_16100, partial [Thermoguttaceae bacterium]